jgi:hypothetical protein
MPALNVTLDEVGLESQNGGVGGAIGTLSTPVLRDEVFLRAV